MSDPTPDFDERTNEAALTTAWDDWTITNIGVGERPWRIVMSARLAVAGKSKADVLRRARVATSGRTGPDFATQGDET